MRRPRHSLKVWKAAIEDSGGSYATIAAQLNLTPMAVSRARRRCPEIDAAIKEEIERTVELAESTVVAAIRSGDAAAAQKYLDYRQREQLRRDAKQQEPACT